MKLFITLCLAGVACFPFAHAVFVLASGTAAASSGIGLTIGTTGTAAAAATLGAAALVAGALLVGGLALSSNRHKRDVSNICLPVSRPELFLELAANADQAGCGLRLVCELEATPDEALTKDEMLILSLFG